METKNQNQKWREKLLKSVKKRKLFDESLFSFRLLQYHFSHHFIRLSSSESKLGIIVTDMNGLCLATDGCGDKNLAPTLLKIIQLANKLDENKKESMAIRIDCQDHYINVKQHNNVIVAVYDRY